MTLPLRFLQLEITDSLLLKDTDPSIAALRRMKSLGLEIFVDDFGTGHSSFAHLKEFLLDGLKIDFSVIRDPPQNSDDAAITPAILAMSQALRRRVVVKSVENQEQLSSRRRCGCDEAQGYLFSRLLAVPDFVAWIAARAAVLSPPDRRARAHG